MLLRKSKAVGPGAAQALTAVPEPLSWCLASASILFSRAVDMLQSKGGWSGGRDRGENENGPLLSLRRKSDLESIHSSASQLRHVLWHV